LGFDAQRKNHAATRYSHRLLGEPSTDVEKVEAAQVNLQLIYPDLSLAIYFADEKIERLVIASDIRTLSGSDIVRRSNSFQI